MSLKGEVSDRSAENRIAEKLESLIVFVTTFGVEII
jgi:hypothetical protein